MTAFGRETSRRIIPRWHSIDRALRQGELGSLRAPSVDAALRQEADEELERAEADWRDTSMISAAALLVGAATVLGRSASTDEAARALVAAPNVPEPTRRLAREVLAADGLVVPPSAATVAATLDPTAQRERAAVRIAELKAAVRRDPRQPLAWAELARQYEVLGQREPGERAMSMAIKLSPDNRFVLRSAARLAVHHGDPEQGQRLLSGSSRTRLDPWLLSAEIATASLGGRTSRLIKHGRRVLDSQNFADSDTTELASALATEELVTGQTKQARRLFDQALEDPTENSVAQVEWASRHGGMIVLTPEHLETPDSYEARAWQHAEHGEWHQVVDNSWLWLAALPFAAAPGVFGSYHASIGRDFEQGAALARAALLANPYEFLLHNNLAFCLLQLDRVEEAQPHLDAMLQLKKDADEEATTRATLGLAAFRRGDPETGRALYEEAIRSARDPGVAVIASIELAREEVLAGTPRASVAVMAARAIAAAQLPTAVVRRPAIELLLHHLDETIARAAEPAPAR